LDDTCAPPCPAIGWEESSQIWTDFLTNSPSQMRPASFPFFNTKFQN
jgi:hypothetical protein